MSDIVIGEAESFKLHHCTAHCDEDYRARAESESGNSVAEGKDLLGSVVRKGRKSLNKALEKVTSTMEAANIPLPESPLSA